MAIEGGNRASLRDAGIVCATVVALGSCIITGTLAWFRGRPPAYRPTMSQSELDEHEIVLPGRDLPPTSIPTTKIANPEGNSAWYPATITPKQTGTPEEVRATIEPTIIPEP